MNFLKWILNILFGWIMDIPFQKMNWASVKEFLLVPKTPVGTILPVQKVYLDSIFGISIFLGLAVLINENSMASCSSCQSLIGFMSLFFPNMIEISHHSAIPQIVMFELSFAYLIMPLFISLFLLRNRNIKYNIIDISSRRFIFGYLLNLVFLCFVAYVSMQGNISFLFHPNSRLIGRAKLIDLFLQTKIGLSAFIWMLFSLTSSGLGVWILMNIVIVKNLIKKANNENL